MHIEPIFIELIFLKILQLSKFYIYENIIKLPKTCIKAITASNYITHTYPIFKEVNIFKHICELQVLKFNFKFKKNSSLLHYLQSLHLQQNQDIHSHNTR